MKKGMTVITTSPAMYKSLHGRTCRRNHAHQPIEGSTWVRDQRVRRSTFTEVYPRKFARLVAQTMIKFSKGMAFQLESWADCINTERASGSHVDCRTSQGHPTVETKSNFCQVRVDVSPK